MSIIEIVFLIILFFSLYSYIFFPAILFFLSKLSSNYWNSDVHYPVVSIVISAYNEELDIEKKVINSLSLDYPDDKLEIIVISDGSTDRTNDIVSEIKDDRLTLQKFTGRSGKTACLNRVVPGVKGDIVVFTDANSIFPSDMLNRLVTNFYDKSIGAVTGWTKYFCPDSGEQITSMYAELEKWIKYHEGMISSCVGADGAIFAIRKTLYLPLGDNDINDLVIPLNVIKQGKRVILDENIFCVENAATGAGNIFSRQVRITTRTAWALRRNYGLLNVFQYGIFSLFLLSHKVLRLSTPFFLLSAFILNIFIVREGFFYIVSLSGALFFGLTGIMALFGIGKSKLSSICKYLLLTFTAQLVGCLRMAVGIEDIVWTPKR